MSPTVIKTLITLAATVAGSCSQIPGLPPLAQVALGALAGFFAGWAHMTQPGTAKTS